MKSIRPLVKYHGGKGRLHKWVNGFIPEHNYYIEPFGGAASVLLNKNPCNIEIYNELEPKMFNLMSVIKNNYDQFFDIIKSVKYDSETYHKSKEIYYSNKFSSLSALERAVITYICKRMSRGGLVGTFSWSKRIYGGIPGEVYS